MRKCPYCGAQIQEQARFCLFCMRPLEEKPDVTPRFRRKWLPIAVAVVGVLLAMLLLLLVIGKAADAPSSGSTAGTSSPVEQTAPSTTLRQYRESIRSLSGFYLDALDYESELWSPFNAFHIDSQNGCDRIAVPVRIDGVAMKLYFIDDGVEIAASISGLSEEDLEQGGAVANRLLDALYAYSGTDCSDAYLTDGRLRPQEAVEFEDSLMNAPPFSVYEEDQAMAETAQQIYGSTVHLQTKKAGYPDSYVRYELRSYTAEGKTLYDMFLFLGQP